jgi:hypothetical protein
MYVFHVGSSTYTVTEVMIQFVLSKRIELTDYFKVPVDEKNKQLSAKDIIFLLWMEFII